jgi:hypothetical protein
MSELLCKLIDFWPFLVGGLWLTAVLFMGIFTVHTILNNEDNDEVENQKDEDAD